MSHAMPFVKWHGRDWLGDPLLRMVGPEVRGVWIDLLCAMMNADPYGHLAVNGRPMSDEEAARMTGTYIDTYKGCYKAIVELGIGSVDEEGMLYSRRLVRDHARFVAASQSGKKGGGNPALKADKQKKKELRTKNTELRGPIKVPYIGHGELGNVQLTAEEHAKLVAKHGEITTKKAIEVLDSYLGSSGKKYKSHYAVLKEGGWVWERVGTIKPERRENCI